MIRVEAPSRLHFGLLSLSAAEYWQDREGKSQVPARRFGGVGLMVQAPGVRLTTRPAPAWTVKGPLSQRAHAAALRLAATLGVPEQPQEIAVDRCGPEHAGLGTGTQLELAVGRAVAVASGVKLTAPELGRRLGRGQRSALGIHGFERGGFLVDAGKGPGPSVAPLVVRQDFPEDWRLVLAVPAWAEGLHGARERQAFQRLLDQGSALAATDTLCRLALLGLLPALAERDLPAFGEALHDFNARVGEAFASAQGGVYAHPRLAELVAYIRQQKVAGVGQSSWGATIFAVLGDAEQAGNLAEKIRTRFGLTESELIVTAACNHGARVTSG